MPNTDVTVANRMMRRLLRNRGVDGVIGLDEGGREDFRGQVGLGRAGDVMPVQRLTIEEVARVSGVSTKTVSRVLRGIESGYSETTAARVRAVANQLGYAPNASARGLASARSFLIALAYDNDNSGYVLQLQLGATRQCRAGGFHLVVEPISESTTATAVVEQLVDASSLHGIIVAPPLCENQAVLDLIAGRDIRCVRIAPNTDRPGMAAVRADDRSASCSAVDYLLSLGHRRIGFVAGPSQGPAASLRRQGFDDAIAACGLGVHTAMATGDFSFKSGFKCGLELLQSDSRPTAIFAANDEMAFGVIAAAHRLGLNVPHKLSVIGFDDSPAASTTIPQLTTVRQPIRDMAAAAASILIERWDGNASRMFVPELVIRASTAQPPLEEVAQ